MTKYYLPTVVGSVVLAQFCFLTGREGDSCLLEPEFVESHPIVYWNLVWYLERANIESHLPDLLCADYPTLYQSAETLPDPDNSGKLGDLNMYFF